MDPRVIGQASTEDNGQTLALYPLWQMTFDVVCACATARSLSENLDAVDSGCWAYQPWPAARGLTRPADSALATTCSQPINAAPMTAMVVAKAATKATGCNISLLVQRMPSSMAPKVVARAVRQAPTEAVITPLCVRHLRKSEALSREML